MNKPLCRDKTTEPTQVCPAPLSAAEIVRLRRILSVIDVDVVSDTLRIETGKAKILLRPDGTIRIEGRRVVQIAQGSIVLNAAAIELN